MTVSRRARVAAVAVGALVTLGPAAIDADAGLVSSRFQPVADAHVSSSKRKANYGPSKRLVVSGSPIVRSYLRFNVRGLRGAVSYASLQLSVMKSSTGSFVVRRGSANHWDEHKIRFTTAPRFRGPSARARRVKSYRMTAIDVTKLVRGNGVVTFVLVARGGVASIASREAATALRPQLVIGVNDAPVCSDTPIITPEDTAAMVDPICFDSERDRLSYAIVSQGSQGRASIVGGKLRYVPRADANGTDRFVYRAKDKKKWSKPVAANVSIRAVNDAPVCAPRALTVNEDGGGAVGALCSDVDGDDVTVTIVSGAQHGEALVVRGELRYTPSPNTNGGDSFMYRARDTTLASAPAPVSVYVNPVNDAPTCGDVSLATSEDIAAERDPSCTDIDGDALSYGIFAQGAKGTASAGGGRIRYAPNANANGGDTFAYHAFDGAAASPPATASVSVAPVNDAPICQAISFETPEDQAREVNPNCVDVEGDAMTVTVVSQPARGSASISSGKVRFVPNTDVTGPDAFSYRASDTLLAAGVPAAVSVMVGPVNDPPVCAARAVTFDEDAAGATTPSCSDPENDTLTYSIVAQATKGVASVEGGNLRYVGNANANGSDSFTYRSFDGQWFSPAVAVTVTIRPVNDDPICANVTLLTNEDVTAERTPSCSDADADPLTYSIVAQGTKGTASVVAGRLRYTPNANQNGADTFTYRASDGTAQSATATTSVTIAAVNDAPSCSAVSLTTNEDVTGERDPACLDVDGDSLTYSIVLQGTKGVASVIAGKLRYLPNANQNGADSFTYRAADATLQSAPATVSVTIASNNDAPACANVSLAIAEDETGESIPSCTDGDGDTLILSIVSQPGKGTASLAAGKLRYTPDANTNGADSFTFRAFDGTAFSPIATASVTVAAVNDAPVCNPVTITIDEDVEGTAAASCADVEGDALTYSIATQATKGTASVVGSNLLYVANPNASGPDQFTYRARDPSATGAPAQATVSIGAVNDPPTCVARTLSVDEDAAYGTVSPLCTDPENESLTYSIAAQGTKGTASVVAGELRYIPKPNANGADSFTYFASDPALTGAPATVTVAIQAINDVPMCVSVALATSEDVTGEQNPACTDIDGDTLIHSIVTPAANGSASIAAGKLRYAPNVNFNGSDSFTYRANDGTAVSAPASVAVTVAAVNDPPVCGGVALVTAEDVAGEHDPSCSDVEGSPLTYSIVTQGTKGTASVVAGKLRYTPNANANGADTFEYRASDGAVQSASATVSVSVAAVNDAPACAEVSLTTSEDVIGERNPSCSDVDGDGLTYAITAQGAKGTASVAAGKLRYAPNPNVHGTDAFMYRASDGTLASAPATTSVTITPVNDAPTCVDVALGTDEDTPGERDPACTDPEGDALTYAIDGQGAKGSASVVSGKLRYAPNANANGADSFTYRASDGALIGPAASVAVTITPVNDAPTCSHVAMVVAKDTPGERDPDCSDVDGDALSYAIVTKADKGVASIVAGKLRYEPKRNATGADSFTYSARDGTATSAAATVAVTIGALNAPACEEVSLTTNEDAVSESDPVCTDTEGDALTAGAARSLARQRSAIIRHE